MCPSSRLIPLASLLAHNSATVLDSASFVLSQLPQRLSSRVRAFESLPFIVGTNPFISRTLDSFRQSRDTIAHFADDGPVNNLERNASLARTLEQLVHAHANDVPTLAKGFHQCAKYMTPEEITAFLDNAIRSRIVVRLIAEQHIAISNTPDPLDDDIVGVVNNRCSPAEMVKTCASFVAEMCDATVGASPNCVLDGDVNATFAYVQVHMEYILTELLKNAYRASVEHHLRRDGRMSAIPPVVITISASPSPARPYMSLRIRDQGGGVSPTDISRIFSYAYSTAGRSGTAAGSLDDDGGGGPYAAQHIGGVASVDGDDSGAGSLFGDITSKGLQVGVGTLAGLGYGLPLARLYCNFFGGSLELKSLHGHGTDVFVKLRNLRDAGDVMV
ncbi:alpha-ketoacid dehydrogenase kinase [Exidia glandulosa HHB12029]|uniref:Protein-serine/threonine kinase n=1 Tax=Exidia glandulosa HHB12029 TaxID=1314781 RepID=A0A165H809_EXIGL|nr:alpha-ketoacid dehydrogenase kinase [Exidia glandulosa HHB12029]